MNAMRMLTYNAPVEDHRTTDTWPGFIHARKVVPVREVGWTCPEKSRLIANIFEMGSNRLGRYGLPRTDDWGLTDPTGRPEHSTHTYRRMMHLSSFIDIHIGRDIHARKVMPAREVGWAWIDLNWVVDQYRMSSERRDHWTVLRVARVQGYYFILDENRINRYQENAGYTKLLRWESIHSSPLSLYT